MILDKKLEKLGFSEKEAKIYLAGLELGPASAQDIAQKSNVKRSTVYEILYTLKKKGVFHETVQGRKKIFIAIGPVALELFFEEQLEEYRIVLPTLQALSRLEGVKPKITFYEDMKDIKKAYMHSLRPDIKYVAGISSVSIATKLGDKFMNRYIAKRKRLGLTGQTIITEEGGMGKWIDRDKADGRETRILPKERAFPINIEILGDRIIITHFGKEDMSLMIESELISVAMKTVFTIMWESVDTNNKQS